jgi:hypothetical protein
VRWRAADSAFSVAAEPPVSRRHRLPSAGNPTRSMIQRPTLAIRKSAEWS